MSRQLNSAHNMVSPQAQVEPLAEVEAACVHGFSCCRRAVDQSSQPSSPSIQAPISASPASSTDKLATGGMACASRRPMRNQVSERCRSPGAMIRASWTSSVALVVPGTSQLPVSASGTS